MKQTAVEQFEAHLIEYGFDLSLHKFEIQTFKAMEKQQKEELIKKACSLVFLAIGDGGDITTNEVIEILKKDGSY